MKSDDLLLFGAIAVGAYLLLPKSSYAGIDPTLPIGPTGLPTGSGGTNNLTTTTSNPVARTGAEILQAAGGSLATIGVAALHSGAVIGHALVGLATNPITWAVAGAVGIGILWYMSQAHHEADEWVQKFQNPFDQRMASIDNQVAAGQISGEQAFQLRDAQVVDYINAMDSFAKQGDDQALVIRQATQTFIQWYGTDPHTYVANVEAQLQALGIPA